MLPTESVSIPSVKQVLQEAYERRNAYNEHETGAYFGNDIKFDIELLNLLARILQRIQSTLNVLESCCFLYGRFGTLFDSVIECTN